MRMKIMRMKSYRGISPVVATLILIIVAVVAGVAVYGFVTGMFGTLTSNAPSPGKFVITAAGVDGNHTNVALNNIGQTNITIPVEGFMVFVDGELKCLGEITDGSPKTINPGESRPISFYFKSTPPGPGAWVIKVVSSDGSSASEKIVVSPDAELTVTTSNDSSNPAQAEDSKAIYRAWCEPVGGNYRIRVTITFKATVVGWIYGELFSSSGSHPIWVGSNPLTVQGTFWASGTTGWYWTPVGPSEMPVKVVIKLYAS